MKFIRISLGVLLSICVLTTTFYGYKHINYVNPEFQKVEYKGLVILWHVDTFEGGKGSRRQFLLDYSRKFESKNKGLKIMVINHSLTSLEQAFSSGEKPDIISFGQGVNVNGLISLDIKTEQLGGVVNDKTYAIPWCRGGYNLIVKSSSKIDLFDTSFNKLIVSQTEYSCPLTALALENVTATEVMVKQPLDAYVDFVTYNDLVLLGTQRDVIRLENRGVEVMVKPLTSYNDLYQYVGITCSDKTKLDISKEFVNYLLSASVQKSLDKIGMLSATERVDYQNQHLVSMQNQGGFSTISVFSSKANIKQMQNLGLQGVKGQKDATNKLKNLLSLS